MSTFAIHPENPQPRLIRQVCDRLQEGAVIAVPTDACYALACLPGDKTGADRIRRIREVDETHHLTLLCRDLSELGVYAKVDNSAFRLMKNRTPGPYTFILPATREVPRRLQHPRRRTIGLRVPDSPIVSALLAELGTPLMSATLQLPGDDTPLTEVWEIEERLGHAVDAIIDGGAGTLEATTVLDLSGEGVEVVRHGLGDAAFLDE
ncbi:tRNA threonylcarbamoyl adenosine modification protein (Sua5/YciO/YrdC/YwlC family) [Thioalkalivibrio sp. ALE21]|uniref:L-threonylcarbamoyladenylate synthase n=1 Tax=Thioalkalivibrio sp. ALE21 TaxID=1158175 RepID=UPI000D92DBF0|nr:L-threonylcarbamoyladenylate synthase [Thioalkalivibrio sp. ALE21]PYG02403.1 tRNA threonylcarbamoyl adenosine modification protein (Sua5/YciO/YrdC/YwlC family) [Thioalkalivibrio sp. ALE21]